MHIDLNDLRSRSTSDLVTLAHQAGVEKATSLGRQDLVFEILCRRMQRGAQAPGAGVLEILPDGFGFLRTPAAAYLPGADDIYVSPSQIRRFHLRTGDYVVGQVRAPKENERYIALIKVEQVNGYDPENQDRPLLFDNLEARHPSELLRFEHRADEHCTRLVDLLVPVGLGQRVLVLGDTDADVQLLYRQLIEGLALNHPECIPFLLLVGARPEDAAEAAELPCEVIATTFEEAANRHTQAAEIVQERARRLAEAGEQVVILVHSLTRLCRAYEELGGGTARMGVSGLDGSILGKPRRMLADARDLRDGGSITVFASLDTSAKARLDRAVFESLEGSTSTRVVLSSSLGTPGVLPGIVPAESGNGEAHRLLSPSLLSARATLRSGLPSEPHRALAALLDALAVHDSNTSLLDKGTETGD